MRRLIAAALVLGLTALPVARAEAPQRLYLLSTTDDTPAWSTDPHDPELSAPFVHRQCRGAAASGLPGERFCPNGRQGEGYTYNLYFLPGAQVDEPIAWSTVQPMPFRIAVEVSAPVPYSVHLLIEQLGSAERIESPAATRGPDGAWTGAISVGGPLDPTKATYLGVRVRISGQTAYPISFDLQTAGASWLELPSPVAARSVPQLLAADAEPPPPSTAIGERTFEFRDDAWTAHSFDGRLDGVRSFPVTLAAPAVSLWAWLDGGAEPIVYRAGRAQPGGPGPGDTWTIAVRKNGESLGVSGRIVAHAGLPPGDIAVEVRPNGTADASYAYRLHVLVVYGERTLRAARMPFTLLTASMRTPVGGPCGNPLVPIAVGARVATYTVQLLADSPNPTPRWTISYAIPNLGSMGCPAGFVADHLRFTPPHASTVGFVAPLPAYDAMFPAAFDTRFEALVRFTYDAA